VPLARFETPSGVVDGVNKIFFTSAAYRPYSVQVVINGLLRYPNFVDGWAERGGKKVELREPPQIGDVVKIFYVVL